MDKCMNCGRTIPKDEICKSGVICQKCPPSCEKPLSQKCEECPIETIEKEIAACNFECEGGLLINHRGYMALLAKAKQLQAKIEELEGKAEKALNFIGSLADQPLHKDCSCPLCIWINTAKEAYIALERPDIINPLQAKNEMLIEQVTQLEGENKKLRKGDEDLAAWMDGVHKLEEGNARLRAKIEQLEGVIREKDSIIKSYMGEEAKPIKSPTENDEGGN